MLLWAIAVASFCATAGLYIAGRIDAVTFGATTQSSVAWLLPLGLMTLVLAGFRTYYERSRPPVRFVAQNQQSFLHVQKQQDGSFTTQIVARFEVLNLSQSPIYLPEIKLIKPRTQAEIIQKTFITRQHDGVMFGRNVIPPGHATDASADIIFRSDIIGSSHDVNIKLKISDQFGRWHRATIRHIRIT